MLERVGEWVRGVWNRMFGKNAVAAALNVEVAVSGAMDAAIRQWMDVYQNTPNSLNLPSAIASELARMVTIEMKSELSGSSRADFLNKRYQAILGDVRNFTEYAVAGGGLILKPYVSNGEILTDYIQAGRFYPTNFDGNGEITGAIFISQQTAGPVTYTRLEHHRFEGAVYKVSNRAFSSRVEGTLGKPVPLAAVSEWTGLEPDSTIANLERPLFTYLKMPFANIVDPGSPLGVSAYARALGLIREADEQYRRILWEYEGSELAIDVDLTAFKKTKESGYLLPKGKERLFRMVDFADSAERFRLFSPAIRDSSLFNGLNQLLMRIEDACSLARGTLSDPQSEARTATELKILRQRTYATVTDTQKALQKALTDYAGALDALATLYGLAPEGKWEASFDFDDSIVSDRQAEFLEKQQLVTMGVLQPWELRMWYTGETEEQAKTNCPPRVDTGNPFEFGRMM